VENLTYDQINQRTGPTFLAPTASRRRPAPRFRFCRIHCSKDLPCDARQPERRAHHQTDLHVVFRAGNVARDRSTDSRPGVRYEREHLTGTLADLPFSNNWAPRVGAAFDCRGATAAASVRELRPLLRARAQRSRRARVVGRCGHRRRLLRRRADPPDSQRRTRRTCGTTTHFRSRARAPTSSIRTRSSVTTTSTSSAPTTK